MIQLEGMP
jgi:hypothetical protein